MKWGYDLIFYICLELVFFNCPIDFQREEVKQTVGDGGESLSR